MRRPAAVLLGMLGLGCPGGDAPPNLLLVTVDTLRADRLVCYGGSSGAGLCGLFDTGIRYRWAFSSAPHTAPAVATLLSSRYPASHGVTRSLGSVLADEVTTVAEVLAAAGYTTAAFVSNPVLDRRRNLDQGFGHWDQHLTRREPNRPGFAEREAAATTDAALAWALLAGREPWFVWVHYQDPHGPYDPPGAAPPRDPPGAPRLPVLPGHSGRGGIPAYQALPGLATLPGYERRYREEIRYLDGHLVRLVRGLDARAQPPAVLLTADHGEAFGEDGYYFAHGHSVGLDQIRVPLLARRPGGAAPRVVDEAVGGVDVAPTLLAWAGLPVPEAFRGRVLPGSVDGAATEASPPVFAEHERRVAVIHGGRFYSRARRGGDAARARTAVLGGGDALPPTLAAPAELPPTRAAPGDAADPARRLREFLEGSAGAPAAPRADPDEALRARARALGYLEPADP